MDETVGMFKKFEDYAFNWTAGNGSGVSRTEDLDDDDLFKKFHDERFLNSHSLFGESPRGFCKRLLNGTFGEQDSTRIWDILILIPNACFLLFLVLRFRRSTNHLSTASAPAMTAFYNLIFSSAAVGVARCLMSIFVCNLFWINHDAIDKALFVIWKLFLLTTELSVLAFAVTAAHLESKASVNRAVIASSLASLVFCTFQLLLEFYVPDPAFKVLTTTTVVTVDRHLYGQGGRLFLLVTSLVMALAYGLVLLLPALPFGRSLVPPHKRTFYYYGGFMLAVNAVQSVGSALACDCEEQSNPGLCFVNLATYVYYVAFLPVVYFAFLSSFFEGKVNHPDFLFSYRAQLDEADDDAAVERRATGMFLTSAAPPDDPSVEDLLSQEQNTPIIISGSLGLAAGR